MTFLTTTASNSGILPSEYAQLITKPLTELALPFQPALATKLTTSATEIILPSIESDVSAAWVAEGEEITPDDPTLDETAIKFSKVAGLSIVSREMANDSSPQAQEIIGQSITRSIIAQVNKAFLGNLPAPAPKGLASVTGVNQVLMTPGMGTIKNLDKFAAAVSLAEMTGRKITGWIINPTDAGTLALIKETEGSNKRLIESVATLEGLPVHIHADVPKGIAWGVDASYVYAALREDVELAISEQAYFTSDRVAIRATARIGYGFTDPKAITKIELYDTEAP